MSAELYVTITTMISSFDILFDVPQGQSTLAVKDMYGRAPGFHLLCFTQGIYLTGKLWNLAALMRLWRKDVAVLKTHMHARTNTHTVNTHTHNEMHTEHTTKHLDVNTHKHILTLA